MRADPPLSSKKQVQIIAEVTMDEKCVCNICRMQLSFKIPYREPIVNVFIWSLMQERNSAMLWYCSMMEICLFLCVLVRNVMQMCFTGCVLLRAVIQTWGSVLWNQKKYIKNIYKKINIIPFQKKTQTLCMKTCKMSKKDPQNHKKISLYVLNDVKTCLKQLNNVLTPLQSI